MLLIIITCQVTTTPFSVVVQFLDKINLSPIDLMALLLVLVVQLHVVLQRISRGFDPGELHVLEQTCFEIFVYVKNISTENAISSTH